MENLCKPLVSDISTQSLKVRPFSDLVGACENSENS